MPAFYELEAQGEPRWGDALLLQMDRRNGIRWRPQYEQFVCRKCHTVDERACFAAGLPAEYHGPKSNADVYVTWDCVMIWSRRFASIMRRLAGKHIEFFDLPGDRTRVVPWPRRIIEPPPETIVTRSRDWRAYPHAFQTSAKGCPGCGRKTFTFHAESFSVPPDVAVAAVAVNPGDPNRLVVWIVSEAIAGRIPVEDLRGLRLRPSFKSDPSEAQRDVPGSRRAGAKTKRLALSSSKTSPKRRRAAGVAPVIDRSNAFGRLTEHRLRRFERTQLRGKLPADYRRFLLKHNGGLPRPPSLAAEADDVTEYPVRLFALHDRRYDDGTPEGSLGFPLQAALKDLRSEPPQDASHLLPFGADWGGNYYCIAVGGEPRGRVFRLDHEVGTTADEAETFMDFLRQVQ